MSGVAANACRPVALGCGERDDRQAEAPGEAATSSTKRARRSRCARTAAACHQS